MPVVLGHEICVHTREDIVGEEIAVAGNKKNAAISHKRQLLV